MPVWAGVTAGFLSASGGFCMRWHGGVSGKRRSTMCREIIKAGLDLGCRPSVSEPAYYPEFLTPSVAHDCAKLDRQRDDRSHAILLTVELPPADELMRFADQLTADRGGKYRMIQLVAKAKIGPQEKLPPPHRADGESDIEPEFVRLLELAKRGKNLELPAMERGVRNIVLAVLDNAEAIDDDISFALDILTANVQSESARDAIREEIQ